MTSYMYVVVLLWALKANKMVRNKLYDGGLSLYDQAHQLPIWCFGFYQLASLFFKILFERSNTDLPWKPSFL